MNYFQAVIAVVILLLMPLISMAQEGDVTMEVIESLDDVSKHHRIKLPSRAVVQDVLDMAVEKVVVNQQEREARADSFKVQRDQIDALVAGAEEGSMATSIAQQRELRQNRVSSMADKPASASSFNDGMAGFRTDMADRRQELVDELKEDNPGEAPTAILSDPVD